MLTLTRHAETRMQHRAIPRRAIELLYGFGSSRRVRSADTLFFDKDARRRLVKALGQDALRCCERWLNIYAVVGDDGQIITVAHRTRRLRRN